MKRSILSAVFAVIFVIAVAFLIAPKANAASVTLKDGETLNITADTVLDLAGNSGFVYVAEGVKLSVIDSGNKSMTGEGAGKLTVLSGSVEAEAEDAAGRRFLKLQNTDGTFSFHPFYLTIKQVGINTNKSALCLQAMFVANEVAQQAISTGIVYGEGELTNAAPTYGAFAFEDGVMYAYYDLIGSLADQAAMEKVMSFQAYIAIGDATVYSKTVATVSPLATLNTISENYNSFSEKQQTAMMNMIDNNPQLHEVPAIAELIRNKDLPKMEITKDENPAAIEMEGLPIDLSIKYTFIADDEYSEKYNDWKATFCVTADLPEGIEKADFLFAGYYEANGAWEFCALDNVIDGATVDLLGATGLVGPGGLVYGADIQGVIKVFECGVIGTDCTVEGMNVYELFFEGDYDNPAGTALTVELRLTNPEDANDYVVIGVFEYTFQ